MEKRKDMLYLISPYGLGDTMILCGLKDAIKQKYKSDIHFIIKSSHEVVMDMYEIEEYSIETFSREDLLHIGKQRFYPECGELFVAHPDFHESRELFKAFLHLECSFIDMYIKMFGLEMGTTIELPHKYPIVTKQLRNKVKDLENVVLIAPEMSALEIDTVSHKYFSEKICKLREQGEDVVINMIGNGLEEWDFLKVELTLQELITLSINCKQVISARAGLCDLIFNRARNIEVIYPNIHFWKMYNFMVMFNYKENNLTEYIFNISKKLKEKGYFSCAVYGLGVIGERVLEELQYEEFDVRYAIDINAVAIKKDIPVYKPDDMLPQVDVVIVTLADIINNCHIVEMLSEVHGLKAISYRSIYT